MQNDDDKTQGEQNQQQNTENVPTPTQPQTIPVNFSTENKSEDTQENMVVSTETSVPSEQQIQQPIAEQPAVEVPPPVNADSAHTEAPLPNTPTITTPVITPMVGAVEAPMTPVVPKKKISKKILLIVAVIVVIILASVGVVLAYMSMQATPQERLQKAIVNSASIQGLQQDLVIESTATDSKTKGTISMQSDLSDPSVTKSKGTLDVDVEIYGIVIGISSEFVCMSQTECYVNYSDFSVPEELSDQKPAFLGKWLQFNPSDEDAVSADPLSIITATADAVLGEIITGNISGNAKESIEKYASNNTTYTFVTTTNEDVANTKTIKYDLKLETNDILDINKAVAEQYKLDNPYEDASDISDRFSIWVDKNTNNIVKAYIKQGDVSSTVTFSKYNEKPTITAPESFLKPSEYTGILAPS